MRAVSFIAPPAPDGPVEFTEAMLWAGDLVVSPSPVRMSTILGSCVSVCLYDGQLRCGGMNHFLVPRGGQTLIHGEWATAHLVDQMKALGSRPRGLMGKLFGGGCPLQLQNERLAVGRENVAVARRVLEQHGIPIVAERVGHGAGVRLFFENWTGVVWLRPHEEKFNHGA